VGKLSPFFSLLVWPCRKKKKQNEKNKEVDVQERKWNTLEQRIKRRETIEVSRAPLCKPPFFPLFSQLIGKITPLFDQLIGKSKEI